MLQIHLFVTNFLLTPNACEANDADHQCEIDVDHFGDVFRFLGFISRFFVKNVFLNSFEFVNNVVSLLKRVFIGTQNRGTQMRHLLPSANI